jgi:hypothetical protein
LGGIDTSRLEGKMACQRCGSVVQQELDTELSASFPNVEKINFSPVYFTQRIFVCLECGFARLMIPAAELERLRKGAAASGSAGF